MWRLPCGAAGRGRRRHARLMSSPLSPAPVTRVRRGGPTGVRVQRRDRHAGASSSRSSPASSSSAAWREFIRWRRSRPRLARPYPLAGDIGINGVWLREAQYLASFESQRYDFAHGGADARRSGSRSATSRARVEVLTFASRTQPSVVATGGGGHPRRAGRRHAAVHRRPGGRAGALAAPRHHDARRARAGRGRLDGLGDAWRHRFGGYRVRDRARGRPWRAAFGRRCRARCAALDRLRVPQPPGQDVSAATAGEHGSQHRPSASPIGRPCASRHAPPRPGSRSSGGRTRRPGRSMWRGRIT